MSQTNIPDLYVLVDESGALVHHAGKSTGRGPMVYDDLRAANRACSRVIGSQVKVISGAVGVDKPSDKNGKEE